MVPVCVAHQLRSPVRTHRLTTERILILLVAFYMLIVATRERGAVGAQIESVRRELNLYLSVPVAHLGPR
jgi:hypothetical protein